MVDAPSPAKLHHAEARVKLVAEAQKKLWMKVSKDPFY